MKQEEAIAVMDHVLATMTPEKTFYGTALEWGGKNCLGGYICLALEDLDLLQDGSDSVNYNFIQDFMMNNDLLAGCHSIPSFNDAYDREFEDLVAVAEKTKVLFEERVDWEN